MEPPQPSFVVQNLFSIFKQRLLELGGWEEKLSIDQQHKIPLPAGFPSRHASIKIYLAVEKLP
jgi:hypothetical protein